MRFATDTGGTFTDLVVEDDQGALRMYKASTTPDDPVAGVMEALKVAADDYGLSLQDLLSKGDMFIHGTTHAINAVITGNTAKTAFITTEGHRDILLMREGGRSDPFNHRQAYPKPYIPRALSYGVTERIDAEGRVVKALDVDSVLQIIEQLKIQKVAAISVCLLWSVLNPDHELKIAALLDEHLPDVPYSLSHQLNPVMREYRRASATSIDASLKPLMSSYLGGLVQRLRDAAYDGRVLVLTSQGGMVDAEQLAQAPIQTLNSGPSMAPVAGRYYGAIDCDHDRPRDIIVADTGGTTYDVSLVRDGHIPMTRDMWLGAPYLGHLTGFPSIEVTSVGAGGGSVAWVDKGGLLHVGPQSQGSEPGPACYQRGGELATVTDAAVALGYLDPDYFLGGKMQLDSEAANSVIQKNIADRLGISLMEAAAAIMTLATENMAQAIIEISIGQGVDPAQAVLIGGGGAAGLNSIFIARRLGCPELIIPELGATMSAAGATMADLSTEYRQAYFARTSDFDYQKANEVVARLINKCQVFIDTAGKDSLKHTIKLTVEARYENQVWEIDVPLPPQPFDSDADLQVFIQAFHDAHQRIFAFHDQGSTIEIVNWAAKVNCPLRENTAGRLAEEAQDGLLRATRLAFFDGFGSVKTPVYRFGAMTVNKSFQGPAIVESPFTTIVIDPPSKFQRSDNGNLIIKP